MTYVRISEKCLVSFDGLVVEFFDASTGGSGHSYRYPLPLLRSFSIAPDKRGTLKMRIETIHNWTLEQTIYPDAEGAARAFVDQVNAARG